MLDEKDEKILNLLRGNARMSWQEIGEAVGISRVAARKRVRKLEEAGIIRGYNTCIYRDGEIKAFIEITTTMEAYDEVLCYVSTRTSWVRQIYSMVKENTIMMIAVTESAEDLRYLARIIAKHDGVTELRVNAVAEVIKDVYGGVRRYDEYWKSQNGGADGECIKESEGGLQ